MYPILFQLGPITVYTFGLLLVIGSVVSLALLKRLTSRAGLKMAFITDYLFSIVLGTLALSRLVHVLFKWELYRHKLIEILFVWEGGLSLMGAILGGILYFSVLCLRHHQKFLVWMDAITVPLLSMLGISHFGYFMSDMGLSGDALGIPTRLPWGIAADYVNSPYAGTPVHPIAIYLTLTCLITAFLLYRTMLQKKHHLVGSVFLTGFGVYFAATALTELLKWDIAYSIAGINMTLVAATVLAVAALVWYLRIRKVTSGSGPKEPRPASDVSHHST